MPDHTETPRAGIAAGTTAVLLLCTLLVATAAYGAWSWYRLGRGDRHPG